MWKKDVEPQLMQQFYLDRKLYIDSLGGGLYLSGGTNIPLLVNRALRSLSKSGQLSRANLVRECLDQSQEQEVRQIWNALETYDGMNEKDKRECQELIRDYIKASSNPLVSGTQLFEAALKPNFLEGVKDLGFKAIVDSLSSERYAASILGRSVDGLLSNLEALDDIRQIFGSIPN